MAVAIVAPQCGGHDKRAGSHYCGDLCSVMVLVVVVEPFMVKLHIFCGDGSVFLFFFFLWRWG